jgi:hypothetical protein
MICRAWLWILLPTVKGSDTITGFCKEGEITRRVPLRDLVKHLILRQSSVSAENLKAFVSRILTVPVAPFLEKSILLFIVLFWICHRLGFAHFRKLRVISLGL